jgi:hypothetical protein
MVSCLLDIALHAAYPEGNWSQDRKPRKHKPHREHKPRSHWHNIENQRQFFDNLANQLDVKQPGDWQSVTVRDVVKMGGGFIKSHYSGSLIKGTLAYINLI